MEHKLAALTVCIIMFCCSFNVKAQTTIITYQEDTSEFPNPERGFYHQILSDSRSPASLNTIHFNKLKQDKMTLIRRLYSLTTFRTSPISDSFLQHIQNDMDSIRKNGVKIVLRIAYTFNEEPPHDDASLNVILSHIDQIAPILQKNADVIAYVEAGFIGRWGEWHTSSNNLDNTSDMKIILLKILNVLPKSRAVVVRYQQAKKDIYDTKQALTPNEGFTQTDRARTGHLNDCLCASASDWGTYKPHDSVSLNEQKDYLNSENRFLPQGGETCNLNPPLSDCAGAIGELTRMRWSTLNADYERQVLSGWKSQACYSEISKHLGYRFRLLQATIPDAVSVGSVLAFNIIIRNDAYASPYNSRDIELVLKAKADGSVSRFKINDDPRKWLPENGDITVNVNIELPSNFPLGEYDTFLNLPDPEPLLNKRPEYSIRLANQNVWNDKTGFNSLNKSIIITN